MDSQDSIEKAAVLALVRHARAEWYLVSQLLDITGSATRALLGDWTGFEPEELRDSIETQSSIDADLDEYMTMIAALDERGVSVITVLDSDYPSNLRLIYNRPPFLLVKGTLRPEDDRSIAVVGTRKASEEGLELADRLSRELATSGVTVISGLALGIDGAAHAGALASGGRTVAVVGTGIHRVYPSEHTGLADEIVAAGGAIVSQFWPDAPPTKWAFPLRNITMSGIAVGTVVVEASNVSGARNQARHALEHGKKLFLVESLVMQEEWAKRYAERPGVRVVTSVDEVISALDEDLKPAQQMTLT